MTKRSDEWKWIGRRIRKRIFVFCLGRRRKSEFGRRRTENRLPQTWRAARLGVSRRASCDARIQRSLPSCQVHFISRAEKRIVQAARVVQRRNLVGVQHARALQESSGYVLGDVYADDADCEVEIRDFS